MACIIRVPTEVVKSRAQTSAHEAGSSTGRSASASLAAARYVLKHDGLRGFYRGFGITIMREVRRVPIPNMIAERPRSPYPAYSALCIDSIHIVPISSV